MKSKLKGPIQPHRGEVWKVNFDPSVGDEIAKARPAVVISSDAVGKLAIKTVIPVTKWKNHFADNLWMVRIEPDKSNGLTVVSTADALQIRGVGIERFIEKRSAKIYLRKVEGTLASKDIVTRSEVEFGGNPAKEIIHLAERTRSAVVAMSTHGRTGVDRLMFGSVAEKVLRTGTTPLFLVRAPGADVPSNVSYGSRCTVSY